MAKHGVKSLAPPAVDDDGTMFREYVFPDFSHQRQSAMKSSIKRILSDTIAGNQDFIKIVALAMAKTSDILWSYPLFELPTELTDDSLNYLLSQKEFASNTKASLKQELAQYPVQM